MNKIFQLVHIQLWVVLGDIFSISKNRNKKPKLLYISVSALVVFLSLLCLFYSFMIGSGLKMFHCLEILPAIMMALTCFITLFTTVFKVKGIVFGFRDYDLVMSLPVSTGAIAASRLILLYMLNFMFVIIVMLPMMIAYGILARPDLWFYLFGVVTLFFIPLVPIVIATFLGTILAYAASKFRHSNIFSILFFTAFLVGVMVWSFQLNNAGSELVDMTKQLTASVNAIYPLAGLYTDAVVHYNIMDFLLFLGISIAAFLVYTWVVKKIFKKMNTRMMTGTYHANYKLGELKTATPFKALYQKELKRFISSTPYAINTGFGMVMLTLAAFALIFIDPGKLFGSPEAAGLIIKFSPVYISFCVIMTCSTMVSISLEGKSLWIIKSLPVKPKIVYLAKIAANLTIISPAFIDILVIGVVLKLGFLQTLIILIITAACAIFISCYGLTINLLLPNFNWTTETVVIKNSAATMVTIFSSMAYVAVQFLFILLIPSITWAYLCYFILTVILDIALYFLLMVYGERRYYFL